MASIQFTEADRDDQGFVKAPAPNQPRSLADLLPKPEEIKADAARRQPWTRHELAGLAVVALMATFVLLYAWSTPRAPTAAPTARATTVATAAAVVPTVAPTAAPVRLLAAFAAPDGVTLGTIEATRPMTPTAHYGDEWIQAQVAGSGLVWLRAADLPGVGLIGPDLAPHRPAAAPAPVAQPVIISTPVPCTRDIAQYVVSRQVQAGTLPIGEATGFSCTSAAEAEANTSAHEAEVRASYAQTSTAKP